jgi:dolichol-phosphate mannosyltransferase
MRVSVIVPTLNEAENIEGIVRKIIAGAGSLELEIIVVDDASKDDTQAIVRRLGESLPIILLAREYPRDGLAGAVLAGARAATAGVVLVIDADGSHPPEKIPELALPVIRGEKDMVIGSRYAPGGSTPGWSRTRRLMSRAASAAAWPLTDVHDALSGFFAVRRDLLAEIPSDAAGFKIALEILVRGGDSLRVGEVPIAFRDRELGQSKMGTKVILTYFRRLLALSGWRESDDTMGLAIAKTLLVWAVDFVLFAIAVFYHLGLGEANLLGFAGGAALNAWLKTAQLPQDDRSNPRFLSRMLFVSLLALFLRSGVLGTFGVSMGCPWLVAIFPAIVTGWIVLFLGYALFIWPIREQYGPGVRWRVAGIGATAYLLALRLAFLYTLPVDRSLAAMPAWTPEFHVGDRFTASLRHFGFMMLGANRAGYNLPAVLCWCVAAWAVFQIARRIFDKTTAFRSLLLFSVLPVFFAVGTVFAPATVLVTAWALLLWCMTFVRRWYPTPAAIVCATAVGLFWNSGWLQGWTVGDISFHTDLNRAILFLPYQILLVTPPALLGLAKYPWRTDGRRIPAIAASLCATWAAFGVFVKWTHGDLGLTASGAIWLPLLPFIAFQMQPAGKPPMRFWNPIIYGCIILYGVYFYWLAFG